MVGIALEPTFGNRQSYVALVDGPEQKFGEGTAAGRGRAPTAGGVGLECVLAPRVLIANLVEILAIVFEAEFEAVLALVPGDVIEDLSGVVVVFEGAIGTVAKAAELIREADAGDTSSDWRTLG